MNNKIVKIKEELKKLYSIDKEYNKKNGILVKKQQSQYTEIQKQLDKEFDLWDKITGKIESLENEMDDLKFLEASKKYTTLQIKEAIKILKSCGCYVDKLPFKLDK